MAIYPNDAQELHVDLEKEGQSPFLRPLFSRFLLPQFQIVGCVK